MKQLDSIILETSSVEEIFEVFKATFPEFADCVERWDMWRRCDEEFRGVRVRLTNGLTLLFSMTKEEPGAMFWQVCPTLIAPAPEKA